MENTLKNTNVDLTQKFQNAEQMWFWFVYSRSVRGDMNRQNNRGNSPVCELLDVETMITKLYLSGQLTDEQLAVMKKFGDKKRAPHQYIWAENHDAYLWKCAMETLENAARKKDWID